MGLAIGHKVHPAGFAKAFPSSFNTTISSPPKAHNHVSLDISTRLDIYLERPLLFLHSEFLWYANLLVWTNDLLQAVHYLKIPVRRRLSAEQQISSRSCNACKSVPLVLWILVLQLKVPYLNYRCFRVKVKSSSSEILVNRKSSVMITSNPKIKHAHSLASFSYIHKGRVCSAVTEAMIYWLWSILGQVSWDVYS